jgi:hypothetical protein
LADESSGALPPFGLEERIECRNAPRAECPEKLFLHSGFPSIGRARTFLRLSGRMSLLAVRESLTAQSKSAALDHP